MPKMQEQFSAAFGTFSRQREKGKDICSARLSAIDEPGACPEPFVLTAATGKLAY